MKQKILMSIACFALLAGCKKEMKNEPETLNPTVKINTSAKIFRGRDLSSYLTYAGNTEMTTLNKNLYLYLMGMKKVFREHPEKLISLHTRMKHIETNGLFLKQYINGTGDCKNLFNAEVYTVDRDRGNTSDHSLTLANGMIYSAITYDPVVGLYNAEQSVLVDNEYYLALLVEDDEKTDSTKEYIPALHINADGSSQLELIDAYQSYFQRIPVFVFEYSPKQDYEFMGGKILANIANTTYTEFYNPYWDALIFQQPVQAGQGKDNSVSPPSLPPSSPPPVGGTGQIFYESTNIYSHCEQYGKSQYCINKRILKSNGGGWVQSNLGDIPRNVIDCGCYYGMNFEFCADVSDVIEYSFVIFELDWWCQPEHFEVGTGNSKIRFDYKGSLNTDVYTYVAHESPNVVMPAVNSAKTYSGYLPFYSFSGNTHYANQILRRY